MGRKVVIFCLIFLTCFLLLAQSKVSQRIKRSLNDIDGKPVCGDYTACMWGFIVRRSNHPPYFLTYQKVQSWCKCGEGKVCSKMKFDKTRKMNIYFCRSPAGQDEFLDYAV